MSPREPDQLIDKLFAQDQVLFIIASSVEKLPFAPRDPAAHRDALLRNPSRASMRPVSNRSRLANAADLSALRGARVARFQAGRVTAAPFPIPL
jgi:hypothetical protein